MVGCSDVAGGKSEAAGCCVSLLCERELELEFGNSQGRLKNNNKKILAGDFFYFVFQKVGKCLDKRVIGLTTVVSLARNFVSAQSYFLF